MAYDGPTPPAAYLHDHVHHHDELFRTGAGPLLVDGPRFRATSAGWWASMVDLLSYDFMQRALVSAIVVGLVAPIIGSSSCSAAWRCWATAWATSR